MLMGMMEKTRMVQLVVWVSKVKLSDRASWKAGAITKTMLPLDTMMGARAALRTQPWVPLDLRRRGRARRMPTF